MSTALNRTARFAQLAAIGLMTLLALAGCERERRSFAPVSNGASSPAATAAVSLRPGGVEAVQSPLAPLPQTVSAGAAYDQNAYAVSQGKRLFRWYNCNGCHAEGGGDIGPPLMDAQWLYGDAPAAIYASIAQGRPNGMPSFGGRVSDDQIWQLVAYVRSMSGQLRKDVAPSRADALAGAPPENEREEAKPASAPPAPPPGTHP